MKILCPPCIVCKKRAEIEVSDEGYHRWAVLGQLAQTAFPNMSDDERELLITGTHPKCWDQIFPEEELECEGCQKAEAFLDDPMTIALGVGSEMLPLFKHKCSNV